MNQTESSFLQRTALAAVQSQRSTGIPASITIAQAIFESGWGLSALAVKANNYFGIKATSHAAADVYEEFPTTEFVDGRRVAEMAKFAKYPSPVECFEAHARLLSTASRYAPAMAMRHDAAAFAEQLYACGYSTNPKYAEGLMQLVREFDLTQYDLPPDPPADEAVAQSEPQPEQEAA